MTKTHSTLTKLGIELGVKTLRNNLLKEILERQTPFEDGKLGFRDIEKISEKVVKKIK